MQRFKVSNTGWMCVWDGNMWVPMFQLTSIQMTEYRDTMYRLEQHQEKQKCVAK